MAWRNIWRNRRRTVVTLFGISFGVLLAVLFTGMGDATWGDMIDLAARLGTGHVTVQHEEFLDTPSLGRTLTEADALRERALGDPDVRRAVTRIVGQTMLATAGQSYGALFVGIDPAQEDAGTLAVFDSLAEGEMFDAARGRGIILGKRLADNLRVRLGRKVVYTMTDKRGEIVSGLARVSGIIRTGAPSVDGALCLLPIDTVREALGYAPGEATQVAVYIGDQRRSDAVAERLGATLGPTEAALPWHRMQPELASFITMKVNGTNFFEVIIMILVSAGVFNTLFVGVMERMREFGIMMAIGFTPPRLFALVMWESLWLGLTGIFFAVLVTAGPYYYFYTHGLDMSEMVAEGTEISGVTVDPVMYVDIFPENALLIAAVVLLATMVSGLYPAWRAGRVTPVESIKLV
jgi:ABC-type lipoprotein release transport system permease subunit